MFNLVKGTHDVILDEARQYSYIEVLLEKCAELYGYKEFRTPTIETTELFLRSVGGSSDIVRKEMYTFDDKGGRSITLRPEVTAGTIRSMVNNKLFANQDFPVKGYYCGPCFRYERPQQGRYRQFNQFGVECVGVIRSERDAEVISLGYNSLMMLGFKNVVLKINSLGDEESRQNYKEALKEYFSKHLDSMCSDCHERFNLNILRILDCKVESDRKIIEGAPKIQDYLSESAKKDFETVLSQLDSLGIPYTIDTELVRGLDYYSGVVFEFHYTSKEGKNYGAIGAGGHYNNLVKEIGGPQLEGCGFAMGIERLASVMKDDDLFKKLDSYLDVYLMPIGERAINEVLSIANEIRMNGYSCEVCLENKNIGQMFKKAERRGALYAVIVGDNELDTGTVVLKDMTLQTQHQIRLEDLVLILDDLFSTEDDDECGCGQGDDEEYHCCCGGHGHHDEDHECCGNHDKNHECHHEGDEEHHCCCGHHHEK